MTSMLAIVIWSSKHDEKIMQSADIYEKCIIDEYGITPAHYYQLNGEYPEC